MEIDASELLRVVMQPPEHCRHHVLVVLDDETHEYHTDVDLRLRPYPWPPGAPFAALPDFSDFTTIAAALIDERGDEWTYIGMSLDFGITAERFAAHHYPEWQVVVEAHQRLILFRVLALLNGRAGRETAVWGVLPDYTIAPPPCRFTLA